MGYGSFKVCQICQGPIHRNGKTVHKSIGLGFRKIGKAVHSYCLHRVTNGKVAKVRDKYQPYYIVV